SRGTVCSFVDGFLVQSASRDFGVRQPQSIVESNSFGVTDAPPESTCRRTFLGFGCCVYIDIAMSSYCFVHVASLNDGLRSKSMLPSICDDDVALEYVHTTLVCAVDSKYSDTSNTNGLASTACVDE
ncbi:hypothetical protein Tco_0688495, partial [Tanacetum coccineum]